MPNVWSKPNQFRPGTEVGYSPDELNEGATDPTPCSWQHPSTWFTTCVWDGLKSSLSTIWEKYKGCWKQVYWYSWSKILNDPTIMPAFPPGQTSPDKMCWIYCGVTLWIGVAFAGIFIYYVGDDIEIILDPFKWIFTAIESISEFVTTYFGFIGVFLKSMLGGFFDILNSLASVTNSNANYWKLLGASTLAWAVLEAILKVEGLESDFEETTAGTIFKTLNWPIDKLRAWVKSEAGSLISWIVWVFTLPFEVAIMIVSGLLGLAWYPIELIITKIKEGPTKKDKKLPPLL